MTHPVSTLPRRTFRLALIPLAIASGLSSAPALAQRAVEDNRFYLAPMGTYVLSDDGRHTDDGVGGTLAFGTRLSPAVEMELRATFLDYKGEDGFEDMDIAGGGFGLNVFLAGPGGPYLHFDLMGGEEAMFNGGLGYDLVLGKSFAIRAEALYHIESNTDVTTNDFREPLFNLGFRIPLGSAPEPPPPPPPPPVDVVPAAPPPPPPVCGDGLDNDNDGLIDFPADKGCESLDDGDETDPAPKCAAPVAGQPVTLEGCAVGDTLVLRGVNFDFDKASLTVNAKALLDGVAEALASRPDIEVEIGGHTDGKGSDEYNLRLSDRRSKSVKDYLVKKSIRSSRMTTRGYGETMPVADNETDEGRELNRRVELKVTASSAPVAVAPPVPATAPKMVAPVESAPAPATASSGSTVTIENFTFAPMELVVAPGTTVTWTNADGSAHLVVFTDMGSDRLRKGGTYTRTFTAPGSYPYTCTLHPTMTGTVVVK